MARTPHDWKGGLYRDAHLANYTNAEAVTPDDDEEVSYRALYIGTSGDVTVIPLFGTDPVLFKDVPIGILRVAVRRVRATGTDATDMVGLN